MLASCSFGRTARSVSRNGRGTGVAAPAAVPKVPVPRSATGHEL